MAKAELPNPGSGASTKARDAKSPVSTLALQIVHAAVQPDVSVADLALLAEKDAAFAARLLSLINSPVHAVARKVTDVRQAAALLGARGIRDIALALSVTDLVPLGPAGEVLMAICLRRAAAARGLAVRLKLSNSGECFTAGLLLELGILMSARLSLEGASALARSPVATRILRERSAGLPAHPVSGADIALEWHLPEVLVHAIRYHHESPVPRSELPHVAWAAERVAAVFEGGNITETREVALSAMSGLGIKRNDGEAFLTEMPGLLKEAASSFGRSVGAQPDSQKVLVDVNAMLYELNQSYQELVRTLEAVVEEKAVVVDNLREANERLERLAAIDGLTGVLNRRAFNEAMVRDVARTRRSGDWLSVAMLDVDFFKKVNDGLGHPTGDKVLSLIGKALGQTVRAGDVVGRYGGEEFVILLPATDGAGATVVAERLRLIIRGLSIEGPMGPFNVTASFGVASAKGDGASNEDLVARADAALYRSKQGGRDRVSLAEAAGSPAPRRST